MKKIAVVLAIGAAALLAGSAASAADNTVKARASADTVGSDASQTDFSSHKRKYRHRHQRVHRHHIHRSYGYVPQAYYAPQPYYGGGAPIISFGFGGGGGHWGHRGHRGHHHGGHHHGHR